MDMGEGSKNHCGKDGPMSKYLTAKRFTEFLDKIHQSIYPEQESQVHQEISKTMLESMKDKPYWPQPPAKALDVGCGRGYSLMLFKEHGHEVVGLTLGGEDAEHCASQGFHTVFEDMSFTSFPDGHFDIVWARHCLEHSPWPLLTLTEWHRILKPAGVIYIEVPAPDTCCAHETNENHYSVFGWQQWKALLHKANFELLEHGPLAVDLTLGRDTYYVFIAKKERDV